MSTDRYYEDKFFDVLRDAFGGGVGYVTARTGREDLLWGTEASRVLSHNKLAVISETPNKTQESPETRLVKKVRAAKEAIHNKETPSDQLDKLADEMIQEIKIIMKRDGK